jgi:hypothetical protein
MNASTARALLVGLLFAVWVWVGYTARLNVSVWAGLVGIGCVFAAGGGVPGLQKALFGTLSGVVWVLLADAVRIAIGGTSVVVALIWGAMACGMMFQARLPFLSFTAGAFAGAGVARLLGANTVNEGIRVGIALAVGAVLAFVAERVAGAIAARRA